MKNLRALRLRAGKKQSEVADDIGIERSTYVKWETGRNMPSVDMLKALADYFQTSTDHLLEIERADTEDKEIWELREEIRRNPELNMLLSTARGATKDEIVQTVKILKALKGD